MWNWIGQVEQLRKQSRPVSLVTVAAVHGSAPREVGAKMLVQADGTFFGTIGGGNLEFLAIEEAKKQLANGISLKVNFPLGAKTGQCCGGTVELLFESLHTGPQLYVFGAGHVGQAIAKALNDSIFSVHVIDEREEWTSQLPPTVISHTLDPEIFISQTQFNSFQTYFVVLTHRHDLDETLVQLLLKNKSRYLGLVGSSSKWQRFQQRLRIKGVTEETLRSVKCPIGIGNLGKSPSEIAISVGAELLQLHYGS
ncbi:MAG: xanthine dehydrogenase accessory protein XdhC [Bdellovibrionales bacterium]|nr:xanthine dehydrogenase accessory protein XdhC [Bdellovibrionales bacterium]